MAADRSIPQAQRQRGVCGARMGIAMGEGHLLRRASNAIAGGMTPAYNESMQIVRHRSDALSWWFFTLMLAVTAGDVHGQDGDVGGSPIWQKVHADVFAGAPIDVGH